ncbi:MAG: hypothetical protein ITF98_07005 [Fermentimonas sp.]|nr:hypothetical protein [Fermentimonas sp.]
MAKVLRLHKQGDNTINDWGNSAKYSNQVIDQIVDPNGQSPSREITSIPSPFARMDLVKSAFKVVVESPSLEGNTIYHKMVSDSLDVGQIFFDIDKFKNLVEIIVWDKGRDIKELAISNNEGHKLLGKTYEIYLNQDAESFNFDKLKCIYILNYKYGKAFSNIIGGTSPASLFFSPANDLSYISSKFSLGSHSAFDGKFTPLYKRNFEYQKYWFYLQSKFDGKFSQLFPEVNEYLDLSYEKLNWNEKEKIRKMRDNTTNVFLPLTVSGAGHNVEVVGYSLEKNNPISKAIDSDFAIKSKKKITELTPLVLPIGTLNEEYVYTPNNIWKSEYKAPVKSDKPLEDRQLPNDGMKYPFLTISDFLEDTIIELPGNINRAAFFDGNLDKREGKSYLLPIKKKFFKYFYNEDLTGVLPDGKKMIELKIRADSVAVELRIPTKKNYIEYKRTYIENYKPNVDETNNDGAVVKWDFTLGLIPAVDFIKPEFANYRVSLISTVGDTKTYDLAFYKNNEHIGEVENVVRNVDIMNIPKSETRIIENELFDTIEVSSNMCRGIIIPQLRNQTGNDRFAFAIDFGTTNTHIEYSINDSPSRVFDITEADKQIEFLFDDIDDIHKYIFDYDLIPEHIGVDKQFNFPTRTALSVSKNANYKHAVYPLAHASLALPYEKRVGYKYNYIKTNLKWSIEENNDVLIRKYIESIFILIRNKVALNNGDISATKIIWFYPTSMAESRYNLYKRVWRESYMKFFGDKVEENLVEITESIAPYKYYKESNSVNNIVNIDIGGGTSDIAISYNGKIESITSFRFAANSIFGNGYSIDGLSRNGIVEQYMENIKERLESNSLDALNNVYTDLINKKDKSDMASFFFSLKDNKDVKDKNLQNLLDFNDMLQKDEDYSIVFLIFYVALIYHFAHILKSKGLKMPRHLSFSGKGSLILQILTPEIKTLEQFTKLIIEKVFREQYHSDGLDIIHNIKNPKEATCKGGIISNTKHDYEEIENLKVVLKGYDMKSFIKRDQTYESVLNDENYIESVVNEVIKFFDFTFSLNSEFSFKNKLNVSSKSLEIAKKVCYRDLETFTKKGIDKKLEEVSKDDKIEESFFFYPLNGVLNALTNAIFQQKTKN